MVAVAEKAFRAVVKKHPKVRAASTLSVNVSKALPRVRKVCMLFSGGKYEHRTIAPINLSGLGENRNVRLELPICCQVTPQQYGVVKLKKITQIKIE